MPSIKESVALYQRQLVDLTKAHAKASDKLVAEKMKREAAIKLLDERVNLCDNELRKATLIMAETLGPELTSKVLNIDLLKLKSLLKRDQPPKSKKAS